MKKHLFYFLLLSLLVACKQYEASNADVGESQKFAQLQGAAQSQDDNAALIQAFQNKKSNIFVEGRGVVKKRLPDDSKGWRHQRFLVSISPEQTLLFAHNIDLASVVPLGVGDSIQFRGEYVYNPKGGVMHWTHHDPKGEIEGGWIKHNGKTYQ